MKRTITLSTVAIALLGSAAMLAQAQQQQMQPDLASFFVAENSIGTGNLGGLSGADQICQTEAQAIGGRAAARTWHAYLSQEQRGATPRINARDRIGSGPWYNVKGQMIASSIADLHGDQAGTRDRNNRPALDGPRCQRQRDSGGDLSSGRQPARYYDWVGSRWPGLHRWL
jgi:hypothetical protein